MNYDYLENDRYIRHHFSYFFTLCLVLKYVKKSETNKINEL